MDEWTDLKLTTGAGVRIEGKENYNKNTSGTAHSHTTEVQ